MRKNYVLGKITLLIALIALNFKSSAGVKLWIHSAEAPDVYIDNVTGYNEWPGKQLTISDGSWWLCDIEDATPNIVIFSHDVDGERKQTADIKELGDGTHYLWYNGYTMYMDVTATRDRKAYAFLQPNANGVEWDKEGATFYANGDKLIECGSYNNGAKIYLWTGSDNFNETNLKFERRSSDGSTVFNSFTVKYNCGGFYEPTNFEKYGSGKESDTQYRDIKWPNKVAINVENFPDVVFRAWVLTNANDGNGYIDPEIKYIDVTYNNKGGKITDLTGIEHFTKLDSLCIDGNAVRTLDVTPLTDLRYLFAGNNGMSTLSFNNPSLISVCANNNELAEIDLSGLPNLMKLELNDNKFNTIDISQCTKLKNFSINNNNLSALDVTKNKDLSTLMFNNNNVEEIDLSKSTNLGTIGCDNNKLPGLDLSNTIIRYINAACMGERFTYVKFGEVNTLVGMYCNGNKIKELDVTRMTNLIDMHISDSELTELDLSNNKKLQTLSCSNNHIATAYDMTEHHDLKVVYADNNLIPEFKLGDNHPSLRHIHIGAPQDAPAESRLKALNLIGCPALTSLICNFQDITAIDLRNCHNIERVLVQNNKLETLDLDDNTKLKVLYCDNNRNLQALNVTNCYNIEQLWCGHGSIKTLDLSNAKLLRDLRCNDNPELTGLNLVSKNFTYINCQGCKIETLDVSGNPNLETLYCSQNRITSLDVSASPNLTTFQAGENRLLSIDISHNPKLKAFGVWSNSNTIKVLKSSVTTRQNDGSLKVTYFPYLRLDDVEGENKHINEFFRDSENWINPDSRENVGFDINNVTQKYNIEVVNGSKNRQNASLRGMADNYGVKPSSIEGDIMLLDTSVKYISYQYKTGYDAGEFEFDASSVTLEEGQSIEDTDEYKEAKKLYDRRKGFELQWFKAEWDDTDERYVITGIDTVVGNNVEIAGYQYYDVSGRVSSTPWEGINIVVTTYSDGSVTTQKLIR